MDFITFIEQEKNKTNTQLKATLDKLIVASTDIDEDYGQFAKTIAELILRGGKRLRPLLVRLSHDLVTDTQPEFDLVTASIYVELLHLFMLVHDDIADQDLLRYGGPTLEVVFGEQYQEKFGEVNKHFGTSLALIGGDLIHVLANGVLIDSQLPDQIRLKSMRYMQQVLHQVIAGWHIHFWQNHIPLKQAQVSRYLKGMQLVSASYTIQGPLELGLILAQKQRHYSQVFNQIGYNMGMAFQIQDDILGIFGDPKVTGKPAGNDIREGKKTLLILDAYRKSSPAQQKILTAAVGDNQLSQTQLSQVKEIITATNALTDSQNQANQHIETALELVESLDQVAPEPKKRLKQLAEFLLNRDK